MCEHCAKVIIRSKRIQQPSGETIPCLYLPRSEAEPECSHEALYEVLDMLVEGHCCEEHFRHDVKEIGDDVQNFLPIQIPDNDEVCDGGYSDVDHCEQTRTHARVAGGISYYCEQHAAEFKPYEPANVYEDPNPDSRISLS